MKTVREIFAEAVPEQVSDISERQAWASILKRRELLSSLYYLALCKDTLRKRDSLLREAGILLEVMRFTVAFCGMNW